MFCVCICASEHPWQRKTDGVWRCSINQGVGNRKSQAVYNHGPRTASYL